MLIDDLIVLGRACPEPIKDGRITVCLGGYSYERGFVRIYPTKTNMPWKRWDIVSVEVEKDPRDSRAESWKIAGAKTDWDRLPENIKIKGKLNQKEWHNLIPNLADGCITDINKEKRSLGIIKPKIISTYFAKNPLYGKLFQPTLPVIGEKTAVKRDFPQEPRTKYRCSDCQLKTHHDQQILEWGFYEWIRKHPNEKEQVWENAKINTSSHDIYFFVGNQMRYRSSFIIISVLRIQKQYSEQIPLTQLRKWMPLEELE